MTLSKIIYELRKTEEMFGDIPLEVMIEDSTDRRNKGMLATGFVDVFTNIRRGEGGRVAILRVETPLPLP